MATTVVQATEHVLVESATAVASKLGAVAAAEFKTIEKGIAQEVVSATDDDASNILDKIEGAVEVVLDEVVEGAEHVVEAVKQHPELIAEGALAAAIGVASLVQPELMVGGIAIIGKMASDSAKKTVTEIASTEGEKVVKAISKNLADDAKIEAEKDKLQAEEKKKAEGGEVAIDEAPKITAVTDLKAASSEKAIAVEVQKPAVTDAKAHSGEKTIAVEVQKSAAKPDEGTAPEKDAAPVELKITIGSDGQIKAVSQSVAEEGKPVEKTAGATVAEKTVVVSPVTQGTDAPVQNSPLLGKDEIAVAEAKKSIPENKALPVTEVPTGAKSETKTTNPEQLSIPVPVSKEISIHSTQETLPVTENVSAVGPAATDLAPKTVEIKAADLPPVSEAADSTVTKVEGEDVQPRILAELGIVHTDLVEKSVKNTTTPVQENSAASAPEEAEESFVQQLLHRSNLEERNLPVGKADRDAGEDHLVQQQASVESVPGIKKDANVLNTVISPADESTSESRQPIETISLEKAAPVGVANSQAESKIDAATKPTTQDIPEKIQASTDLKEPVASSIASHAKELAESALQNSSTETGPTLVTATASVTNITKTMVKTVEEPSSSSIKMVHTLALHLPVPPAVVPLEVKDVTIESTPELVTQKITEPVLQEQAIPATVRSTTKPKANQVSPVEDTAATATVPTLPDTSPSPITTVPTRPTHVKRGSVIGSIGKFLWPFGGAPTTAKDSTVQVSPVKDANEVESQAPGSQIIAPGLGSTKAVSTVGVTQTLAMPTAA
ncbi:uncharacterized protein RSE6_03179 [Rhynchosporium secalis]|uniref:Uncharacterized protein n=1 Tax=Rhynchosporium secalis TaxID=38038 RepID=A0A1E1M247_RHYSE|nr:uncharacterized protein RSE6_03179 [Rhynchosporium secalis]